LAGIDFLRERRERDLAERFEWMARLGVHLSLGHTQGLVELAEVGELRARPGHFCKNAARVVRGSYQHEVALAGRITFPDHDDGPPPLGLHPKSEDNAGGIYDGPGHSQNVGTDP
jgi:hypothetical protein